METIKNQLVQRQKNKPLYRIYTLETNPSALATLKSRRKRIVFSKKDTGSTGYPHV